RNHRRCCRPRSGRYLSLDLYRGQKEKRGTITPWVFLPGTQCFVSCSLCSSSLCARGDSNPCRIQFPPSSPLKPGRSSSSSQPWSPYPAVSSPSSARSARTPTTRTVTDGACCLLPHTRGGAVLHRHRGASDQAQRHQHLHVDRADAERRQPYLRCLRPHVAPGFRTDFRFLRDG